MISNLRASLYHRHRHRYPSASVAEAVWLYLRFPLSFRMVEDMLAFRGILVTHKRVGELAEKLGRNYANTICRRTPRLGVIYHLDELLLPSKANAIFYGAVDQKRFVLAFLVQKRRNTKAAKRYMRKLLLGQGVAPRVMVSDKLGS